MSQVKVRCELLDFPVIMLKDGCSNLTTSLQGSIYVWQAVVSWFIICAPPFLA